MADVRKVHEHIDAMRQKDFDTFVRLVAQPSVSAQNMGVRECLALLQEILADCGFKSIEVCETSGQPFIFAEIASKKTNAKTLVFYGHYDTQPPEPYEKWISPPFEPTVRDGRLYGRGTGDNKGQFLPHMLALRSIIQTSPDGDVPVNVKFVLDGEEESGSPTMGEFIAKYKDRLTGDFLYNADSGMDDSGRPVIYYGVRGMLQVEMTIETNGKDNHSGHTGGVIKNACWEMVKFLNTLVDDNGRCLVEGFYDDVLPPSEYDCKLIDEAPYDPEVFSRLYQTREPITLSRREFYTRVMFQPTFTINGLFGGYGGPGGKTIVPGSAGAKIDMRLAEAQDPEDIFRKLQAHIDKHDPRIKLVMRSQQRPSRTRTDLPIAKLIAECHERVYKVKPIVMPVSGATNPDAYFTKDMGLPSCMTAYANADESNHAPNENMDIELYHKGIHCSAEVILAVGDLD